MRSFSFERNDSTFRPSFLISVPLTKPRTVCDCQPVSSMISASVAPWERRIRSITSDFLAAFAGDIDRILRGSARCVASLALRCVLLPLPLRGRDVGRRFRDVRHKAWIAVQIRSTATFRFVNFFTGLSSVNGATPAKLFQISTGRFAGQDADQLGQFLGGAEILGVVNLGGAASSSEAKAVMLLFASIVKVFIATPFIALFAPKAK